MDNFQYLGEIRLEQKSRVEQIRFAFSHELSSHAFPSLYLWRNYMELTLYLTDDFFTVKCGVRGKNAWFFPCGNEDKQKRFLERHRKEDDFSLCYLREKDKAFLKEFFPGCFAVHLEEEASEYLYDRGEYETLSGGKFSNMRKQVNRLQKCHSVAVERLCEENIGFAWEVLDRGFFPTEERHSLIENSEEDRSSTKEKLADVARDALENREALGLDGIIVFVDHLPQSLVLGFPLTEDTVDGCIEYSNTAVRGLSYFAKRAFFLSCGRQYRCMNAEEDLGHMGLRMAKRHMGPVSRNMIWNAVNVRR